MKKKFLFISMMCLILSTGDVFAEEIYIPEQSIENDQDSDLAKRRRSRKRSSRKRGGRGDDQKMFAALSLGTGIPMGDYGSSPDGGGASMGFGANATFVYKFIDYLGATVLIGEQMNSFKTYSTEVSQSFYDIPMKIISEKKGTSWNILSFMGGLHGFLPLNDSPFSLGARAMIGFAIINTPELTSSSSIDLGESSIPGFALPPLAPSVVPSTSTLGFAYLFGISAKYDLSNNFCLLFNADYFGTSTNFNPVATTDLSDIFNGGGQGDMSSDMGSLMEKFTASTKMNISSINITIGFGIKF